MKMIWELFLSNSQSEIKSKRISYLKGENHFEDINIVDGKKVK